MCELESILRTMTLEFFGGGKHKISPEALFGTKDALLLDVRSIPEQESLKLSLEHHVTVLRIPTDEIPDRLDEIPSDRLVGVFCSTGLRASMVYAYLRTEGYRDVRIMHGGYEAIVHTIKPGELWRHLEQRKRP
ncbi:MAG: rhodanese-like domain-containing protein [Phycisphaerae bacterium]|nr:rhodanese-like domain-containing protein [Phycisphaerae bacterium]